MCIRDSNMRWSPGQQSEDIEDRRDEGGGGGGIRGTHLGCGGILLLLVLSFVFRTNLFTLFDQVSTDATVPAPSAGSPESSCSSATASARRAVSPSRRRVPSIARATARFTSISRSTTS